MLYQSEDGKYYFEEGKYSKIPLEHVPTEHLDLVLENFILTTKLPKLKSIHLIIGEKIRRIEIEVAKLEQLDQPKIEEKPAAPPKGYAVRRRVS